MDIDITGKKISFFVNKFSFFFSKIEISLFRDEMVNFLQKDYEYLQTFLSTNISDLKLVQSLNKSPTLQQISMIIYLLRTGEKLGPNNSRMLNKSLIPCKIQDKTRLIVNRTFYLLPSIY